MPPGLAFNPYLWAGAEYFRRSRAFLGNTPWMDLAVIMLKPAHPDRWSYTNPSYDIEQLREMILGREPPPAIDFVVQNRPFDAASNAILHHDGFLTPSDVDALFRVARR